MKRLFDLCVASLLLILASPLLTIIAVAVKLDSRGPVLFRATRVGRDGQRFTMFKFRTMRHDQAEPGAPITAFGDPRVTRVGRLLRSSKLDELPQLLNVVRGDMSLVGPRPEDPHYVDLYDDEQRAVLQLRPGMTGPTVTQFRHEERILAASDDPEKTYINDVMPAKLDIDLTYVRNHSFRGDLKILASTARAIVRRGSGD